MAIYLLCFDESSPDCEDLLAQLKLAQGAPQYPSSHKVAPGVWVVVEPNNLTAHDVWMKFHQQLQPHEPLSVINIDGPLADRKLMLDGTILHWADRWRLPPK
jgi:hypothetical protein